MTSYIFTDSQLAEIKRRRTENGERHIDIASSMGLGVRQIEYLCAVNKWVAPVRVLPTDEEILERYEAGLSLREISAHFHIGKARVSGVISRAGVSRPSNKAKAKEKPAPKKVRGTLGSFPMKIEGNADDPIITRLRRFYQPVYNGKVVGKSPDVWLCGSRWLTYPELVALAEERRVA